MTHEHVLDGCTPTPLAHYLKALGVFRLLAEQKDPDATGHWRGERFVLGTVLTRSELERFFLDEYRPSPIVAPWNGASGFYPNDNKTAIRAVSEATSQRFLLFRHVVEQAAAVLGGRASSPKDEEKALLLLKFRARLHEAALTWFDAAIALTAVRPGYPPLLGTGGIDGHLDFTNNYMQRLIDLIDPRDGTPTPNASKWLRGALFGTPIDGLLSCSIGQFLPGNVGGPNASTGFGSGAFVNPWDFVLMLEGALLFSGAATRRLATSDSSTLSFPFTVRPTGSGSGSGAIGDEAPSRAEIWMPLWRSPAGRSEVSLLFAEGRVTLGRRPVRDGLDFARALGNFGADRGIESFQRFGFLMRSGKAFLATPLTKVPVRRNARADLLGQLERYNWLDRMRSFARGESAPGRLRQLVRRFEDAVFALSRFGGRQELQRVLVLLGRVQCACAVSGKARDVVPPVPVLGPEWVTESDDGSPEFRLACAVAGLAEMRRFLLPVGGGKSERAEWRIESRQAAWSGDDLVGGLVRVFVSRLLEAEVKGAEGGSSAAFEPLAGSPRVGLDLVMAFLRREVDDARVAALLQGLASVRLPADLPPASGATEALTPADFAVLKPLFTPVRVLRGLGLLPRDRDLPGRMELVRLLTSSNPAHVGKAVGMAWRRLRAAGFRLPTHPGSAPESMAPDGSRLAVALMIPLERGDLARVCSRFKPLNVAQ